MQPFSRYQAIGLPPKMSLSDASLVKGPSTLHASSLAFHHVWGALAFCTSQGRGKGLHRRVEAPGPQRPPQLMHAMPL
jgi:hypothetical protein